MNQKQVFGACVASLPFTFVGLLWSEIPDLWAGAGAGFSWALLLVAVAIEWEERRNQDIDSQNKQPDEGDAK